MFCKAKTGFGHEVSLKNVVRGVQGVQGVWRSALSCMPTKNKITKYGGIAEANQENYGRLEIRYLPVIKIQTLTQTEKKPTEIRRRREGKNNGSTTTHMNG